MRWSSLETPLTGGRVVRLSPQGVQVGPDGSWEYRDDLNLDLVEYVQFNSNVAYRELFDCSPAGSSNRRNLLVKDRLGTLSQLEMQQLLAQHEQWKNDILRAWQEQERTREQNERYIRGLHTRGLKQRAKDGEVWLCEPAELLDLFREPGLPDDTLVAWDRSEMARAVVLDLDFHASDPRPSPETVERLARDLSPSPHYWWLTQGGGLHAVYLAGECCTAEELAAGALAQLSIDPEVVFFHGTVELKAGSRHPAARQKGLRCGPIHTATPSEDFACLARLTDSGVSEKELDDFLNDKGWKLHESLDHSHCPIDPEHESKSATPVFIGEKGIFCHSCAGRLGIGLRPWLSVMSQTGWLPKGEERLNCIAQAASRLVSWAHASYLFDALLPQIEQVEIRRLLYRALIKKHLRNPQDPRIAMAFDEEWSFVRGDTGEWLHADRLTPAKSVSRPDMLALPSCMDLGTDKDGNPKLIPRKAAVAAHQSNGYVAGWRPLAPHPFIPIYWQHNRTFDAMGTASGEVVGYEPLYCRPKVGVEGRGVSYIDEVKDRLPKDQALERILARWPGINATYLTAILVALGHGESGIGRVPILWAQGPSGSAKTTTLRIMAAMLGEDIINLSNAGEDRLDQLYGEALEKTRFILFDDFAKDEENHLPLNTFFLRLGRTHSSHKLYHGMNFQRVRSPVFLTEWSMPETFVADRQFARRAHMIQLSTIVNGWDEKSDLDNWWRESEEMRQACESWFSWVIDEFFPANLPAVSWPEAMRRLGVPVISDMTRDESSTLGVRSLVVHLAYEIIKADIANPMFDPQLRQVTFSGAVLAQAGATQPVGEVVQRLLDTRGNPKWHWYNLQRIVADHAEYLQEALMLKCPAQIQGRMNGSKLYLRVVEVAPGRHSKRYNQRLCEQWPLPPDAVDAFMRPVTEQPEDDDPPDPPPDPPPPTPPPPPEETQREVVLGPAQSLNFPTPATMPKVLRDLMERRRQQTQGAA